MNASWAPAGPRFPRSGLAAWVLGRGEGIIPLIGARKRPQLEESLGALKITLSAQELKSIEAAMPADAVKGDRYIAQQMAMLDSEKR